MPLRIRCPSGHKLIVPDDRAGRSLRCPRCGQVTEVPGERVEPAAIAPAIERVPATAEAATAPPASNSGSGVFDWPNAIAAPTTIPALAEPPVIDSAQEPAIEPPPPPVVKPKSRALPLRESPPQNLPSRPEPPPLPEARRPSPPPPIEPAPPPKFRERSATPAAKVAPPQPAPPQPALPRPATPPPAAESPPVAEPRPPVDRPTQSALPPAPPRTAPRPPPAPLPAPVPEPIAEAVLTEPSAPPQPTMPPPAAELVLSLPAAEEWPPADAPASAPPAMALGADRGNVWAAYQLAAALMVAALFSMAPAVWDVAEYVQYPEGQFIARWALVLFLLGLVQIAYAAYLVQLPDWTSVWVVTIYSLALAAVYAATLGLVLISSESGIVVAALQLSDKLAGGKAVLWCLSMVSLSTILAFFAGRLSARWHTREATLRSAGLHQ